MSRNSIHRVPALPSLSAYALPLAQMVAKASYLPHPATVSAMGKAVFPCCRGPISQRVGPIVRDGVTVGMFDDNTTPRWALLWSHGIGGVGKQPSAGWTFAHVWPTSKDVEAYTHLANLAMVPECFGSLTDKDGPATHFLRWHAWTVFGWKPTDAAEPRKPEGFEAVEWKYFTPIDDPRGFVHDRLRAADCQRSKALRPLMGL